jgi:Zn-dependent peptidase ImmA (M78 family)
MGLPPITYDKHLSTDFSVFGKICFADEEITVYDELGVPEIVTAKRGQIFIDPDIYNVGCLRNTVAHELFHWVRHRLYVTIMRIFETTDFKSTRCRVRSISERKRDGELSDEEWMELHANSISPRIIMPVETVKSKMLEILRKHKYNPILNDSERSLRAAIIELAEFYEVSKQLATIRLSQLGIEQAQDILDADNERNILYASQIPHTDILREYAENESFRSAVESGLFRYVEGRFIINDTKYISKKQGGIYLLTDYAREHLDECALRFSAVLPDTEKRYGGELNRKNRQSYAAVKKYAEDALRLQTAEARAKANEAFRDEAAYHKKLITAVGSGTCFAECFNALMKVVFDTINVPEHKQGAKFFDITGIATKIYYDMRSAKPDYCPKDRTLVAICAGFDLDISVAEKLFAAGGKALRHTDEHLAFRIILTVCRGWGITERNDYLEVLGFGRLTDDI